jgi:type I restriction enzyme, R subunit
MISYGRKENISEWRDEAVTHLRDRGTFEACQHIKRIMAELPDLREALKWTLDAARAQTRRRTWLPPAPERVLALAARPKARLTEDVRRVARQKHCPIGELLGPLPKEGAHLEYKATFRTRAEEGRNGEPVGEVFKPLETASLKTIAAFLNSREGGTLLIGVNDDGSVYGLESDYASLRSEKRLDKDDRDLFGLHLNQAIINSVGMAAAANVSYEILEVGGEDLCRAHVRPSGFPVEASVTEVDKRGQHRKKVAFYGRFGNATRPVTDEAELERYKQQIWGP